MLYICSMNVLTQIQDFLFRRKDSVLYDTINNPAFAWDICESRYPFGRAIWLNVCELLTNLCNDVTLISTDVSQITEFAEFKRFFNAYAERTLLRLFDDGYVVIGYDNYGFRLLGKDEYIKQGDGKNTIIKPLANNVNVYVMRSMIFEHIGLSDKQVCAPYIEFIDNTLNASNTCSARLGALVVGSPQQSSAMPTATVLTKEQKKDLEENLSKEYGALRNQKQFLLLPRAMQFQTINLASIDQRTSEKVRLAILAICDRIKVPCNQVAIIDANSSKSLSNGSELREGDFNKYQSFERLLNSTFIQMANDLNLRVDYKIYNKPTRQ